MSISPEIKCNFCGYQFKTYGKEVERYDEYTPYVETRYYPEESENARLAGDYVCKSCYEKFTDIIKEELINSCKRYLSSVVAEEFKTAKEKYEADIERIRQREQNIKEVKEELEKAENLLDLPKEIKVFIDKGSPYLTGKYYFKSALNWEKERVLKQKRTEEWEKIFELNVEKYPDKISSYDWVTRKEFLDILLHCRVSDKTPIELLEIVHKG